MASQSSACYHDSRFRLPVSSMVENFHGTLLPTCTITVFPRNLAAARFYFKALFGAATIRGRRQQRLTRTRVYTASIISLAPSCMHVKCACTYGNCCWPLTMQRDFKGGIYWDELADRCGEISRAAGFRGAARFQGNTVCTWSLSCMYSVMYM